MSPALNLLKASKQFKDHVFRQHLQEVAAGVHDEAEEISTSDVQYELEDIIEDAQDRADFPVECCTRIFVNKKLAKQRTLPDTSRDTFDLASLEEII